MAPVDSAVQHIVVGVDGSVNSRAALAWAVQLANQLGAHVTAVHALGLLEYVAPDEPPIPSEPYREAILHRFEHEWCAALKQGCVRGRRLLVDGPPVMVLTRVADEQNADLIVVGRRGSGAGDASMLGSTSSQLVVEATRPVTVVP